MLLTFARELMAKFDLGRGCSLCILRYYVVLMADCAFLGSYKKSVSGGTALWCLKAMREPDIQLAK